MNEDLTENLRTYLDKIRNAALSGAELVEGMMVFSRKPSVKLEPLNLNEAVEQIKSLLAPVMPKMVGMSLVLADDLWTINAALTPIKQILMNLEVNARDAMPQGGELTIETLNTLLDAEFCLSYPEMEFGKQLGVDHGHL
ncbi:MAG: hypothetical protein WCP72_11440 [Desulfomonile sp.]